MHFALLFAVDIDDYADYLGRRFVSVEELRSLYHYPYKIAVDAFYTVFALNKVRFRSEDTIHIVEVAFLVVLVNSDFIDKAFLERIVLCAEAELFVEVFGNENGVFPVVYLEGDIVRHLNDGAVALFTFTYIVEDCIEGMTDDAEFVPAGFIESCGGIAFLLFIEGRKDRSYRLYEAACEKENNYKQDNAEQYSYCCNRRA